MCWDVLRCVGVSFGCVEMFWAVFWMCWGMLGCALDVLTHFGVCFGCVGMRFECVEMCYGVSWMC